MAPYDVKKARPDLYNPPTGRFVTVDVPAMAFLMAGGRGDPNSPAFAEATEALYAVAYAVRGALKTEGFEFVVAPLEGLWWAEDFEAYRSAQREQWEWTAMIAQPEGVTEELVERARTDAMRKKGLATIARVHLETYHEGLAVQTMYVGAYADEAPTISALHAYAAAEGLALRGKHHEIYLGDPRRTPPERLKTILRQPVRPAG